MYNPDFVKKYRLPGNKCNCSVCLRARWHRDYDKRINQFISYARDMGDVVPPSFLELLFEAKSMLIAYWNVVEHLETEKEAEPYNKNAKPEPSN